MNTSETTGAMLHSEDAEARREAAALLGRARSERKAAAARENAKKTPFDEAHRAKLRAAQQARREREAAERVALGLVEEPKEKKRQGRPRTRTEADTIVPKRPRGRPRKAQETAQECAIE